MYGKFVFYPLLLLNFRVDLVNYMKHSRMVDVENTFVLIRSFVRKCVKRDYSPEAAIQTVRQIKYLVKSNPDMLTTTDAFKSLMQYLVSFIVDSQVLLIKLEAISCMGYICNRSWLLPEDCHTDFSLFYIHLFGTVHFQTILAATNLTADDVFNSNATQMQFFSTLLAVNYPLRKRCLFQLVLFAKQQNIDFGKIRWIIDECCRFLNINRIVFVSSNLEYLMVTWLSKNLEFEDFPWQVTDSKDRDTFLRDFSRPIASVLLRYKSELFVNFCVAQNFTPLDVVNPLLPVCLAYLLPYSAAVADVSIDYKRQCLKLEKLLMEICGKDALDRFLSENAIIVVQNLLLSLIDEQLFVNLFGFPVMFCKEEYAIDRATFEACIHHIQTKIGQNNIIMSECSKRPLNIITTTSVLREYIQKTSILEEKLQYFMQYAYLFTHMAKFFKNRPTTINEPKILQRLIAFKRYFLRDSCYFMCQLMSSTPSSNENTGLRLASCKYLLDFCRAILAGCAEHFQSFFAHIITTIVPMASHPNEKLAASAQELLRFFIVEKELLLKDAIQFLDDFPKDAMFDEYRLIHKRIKYAGQGEATLYDELSYFMRTDTANVESLMALREHLAGKKKELLELYLALAKIRGFSEDCEASVLHQVTYKLLRCVQSVDVAISTEAAKCLGELGTSDLTTIVLKSNRQTNANDFVKSAENSMENFCFAAFEQLDKLQLHPDIDVFKLTCSACVQLCRTRAGNTIRNRDVERFALMNIFSSGVRNERVFTSSLTKTLDVEEWFVGEKKSHSEWIRALTQRFLNILEAPVFEMLVESQVRFAERILPILVQYVFFAGSTLIRDSIKKAINRFFDEYDECAGRSKLANYEENWIYRDNRSIKTMLDVLEVVRLYKREKLEPQTDLNYLKAAKAALHCEAYFTAILYSEIFAAEKQNFSVSETEVMHDVLRVALTTIGDSDSASVFVNPIKNRATYLTLRGSWNSLLLYRDVGGSTEDVVPFKTDLIATGFYHLARNLAQKSDSDYESLWRMSDWNVPIPPSEFNKSVSFEEQHYAALKCLKNRDESALHKCLRRARQSSIDAIRVVSLECTRNVYKNLIRLQMLQQIDDFSKIQFKCPETTSERIVEKWKQQDLIPSNHFSYREQILSQRASIYTTFGLVAKRNWQNVQKTPHHNILLELTSAARQECCHNIALRSSFALNREIEADSSTNRYLRAKCILEDAQLQWANGDRNLAKRLLVNLIEDKDLLATISRVPALRLYGEYLSETQSKNPRIIFADYFVQSLKHLNTIERKENIILINDMDRVEFCAFKEIEQLQCLEAMAKYADREYLSSEEVIKSHEFEVKLECVKKNMKHLQDFGPRGPNMTKDECKTMQLLQRNINIDNLEIQKTKDQRDYYLKLAMENYLKKCAALSAVTDLTIFRVISLWLANMHNDDIIHLLTSELPKLQSYKLLPILPQISARLTNNTSEDQCGRLVYQILERCALDHPHHTLNTIFAIANHYADVPGERTEPNEVRVTAAQDLVARLKNSSSISPIVIETEKMCEILVRLANHTIAKSETSDFLSAYKNLNTIQCPTVALAVSPNANYPDIVSVRGWTDKLVKVGGINTPIKVMCKCSDGRNRPQLVKGHDDLRQDALMQQVFTIVNTLLASNKETVKQKHSIRTYKVIPLSQRSGILEWCENTVPIGIYLWEAHKKYRPNDKKPDECRKLMQVSLCYICRFASFLFIAD